MALGRLATGLRTMTTRRQNLALAAVFDATVGLLILLAPKTGAVSAVFANPGYAVLLGSGAFWGYGFLISGIVALLGLVLNGWIERLATSMSAGLAAGRSVGFLAGALLLWPNFAWILLGASAIWARMALTLYLGAGEVSNDDRHAYEVMLSDPED